MWNLNTKIDEQTKQKQTNRFREQIDGRKSRLKKVEGLRNTDYQLQKYSWGYEVQNREYSQQYYNNYVWCQTGTKLIRIITP